MDGRQRNTVRRSAGLARQYFEVALSVAVGGFCDVG